MPVADTNEVRQGYVRLGILWLLVWTAAGLFFLCKAAPEREVADARADTLDVQYSAPSHPVNTRKIEDLRGGDIVLARDENDPNGPIQPRKIEAVFERTSDHLRQLRLRSRTGDIQELKTTDTHPFWTPDSGWTEAGKLKPGQLLAQSDGAQAEVIATAREEHPEGIHVWNFRVEKSHTYFVSAANATGPPVWAHNIECPVFGNSSSLDFELLKTRLAIEELNPELAAQSLERRMRVAQFLFEQNGPNAEGAENAYMTSIMRRYVRNAALNVDAAGMAALTLPQQAAVGRYPGLFQAFRGNRIDVAARRAIMADPILQPLFNDARLTGSINRGPDLTDTLTGRWWDMTTPGQWNAHVAKYGSPGTLLPTR